MTKTNANLANIPAELRTPAKWVRYNLKRNAKNPDKKPSPVPVMRWADPADRAANLRPLDHLIDKGEKQDGFQRFIDKAEGLVFIDLDGVRNVDSGDIEPWAVELIERINSYTEVSKSGKGIHIVCNGTLAEDFHRPPSQVEIYSGNSGKLMAMTGNLYDPAAVLYTTVENRQAEVEQLLREQQGNTGDSKAGPAPVTHWREAFHTVNELDTTPGRVFIKGILEEGITFFGAHSGVGKTWIGLSVAHALITGEPLFGVYSVVERTKVLYLVPEMGGRKFRERAVRMHLPMDGEFWCQTIRDGACDLDSPVLLQAIAETQATVVLDTAIRFQAGDEQSSTQQAQGLGAKMFNLINAGAAAVICMHHRKKELDSEPTLANTLRGTGDFGAMADCVWCVEHASKGKRSPEYEQESQALTRLTLTCVKPRDMDPADPFMIQGRPYINERGDFAVVDLHAEDLEEPVSKEGDEAVLALVKAEPSIGTRAIRARTSFGDTRVNRILRDNGWVKREGLWTQELPVY
jgi:hypothetical protein